MKKILWDTKKNIWNEIRESLILCGNIGEFKDNIIHNEDIPRLIYKGKAVLSDNLFKKFNLPNSNGDDLFPTICQGMVVAASLKLGLNEQYSIIFADCYCGIKFKRSENKSTQYEQIYFSKKFISMFSLNNKWNVEEKDLQIFIKEMYKTVYEWQNDSLFHKEEIDSFKEELSNV